MDKTFFNNLMGIGVVKKISHPLHTIIIKINYMYKCKLIWGRCIIWYNFINGPNIYNINLYLSFFYPFWNHWFKFSWDKLEFNWFCSFSKYHKTKLVAFIIYFITLCYYLFFTPCYYLFFPLIWKIFYFKHERRF